MDDAGVRVTLTTVQIDVKTRDLLKRLARLENRSQAAEVRQLVIERARMVGLLVPAGEMLVREVEGQ